jgi:hypothetical protein
MADTRKADTRKKITLGGLVVKAGLKDASPALILGALLNAAKLDPASPEFQRLLAAGRAAFAASATLKLDGPADDPQA